MEIIVGDLVKDAHMYDAITHGCNCFNTMGAGIAAQIAKAFPDAAKIDKLTIEGDFNKLGTLGYTIEECNEKMVYIINSYTQYYPGPNFDLDAIKLCFRKINHIFKGKHVGIPLIGAGIAGGDWKEISEVIKKETPNIKITVVVWDGDKENIEKYVNSKCNTKLF